ncbi:unnamed protein product [Rotaria sp. Silwood2]|nr:unnamed protein product [Rotaria sp. Silwood2]
MVQVEETGRLLRKRALEYIDTTIENNHGQLKTTIYHKSAWEPNILSYESDHLRHVHASNIYTMLVRAARICSTVEDFDMEQLSAEMILLVNGYPPKFIQHHLKDFFVTHDAVRVTEYNKIIYLNVGGELISTTYGTLTYVPNTKLSFFNSWPRDNRGHIFLDLPPDLFKYFLHQLRRWSIRGDRLANAVFEPPSWKVKDEFNEMIIALVAPVQCTKYRRVDDFTRREGSGAGRSCDTNETAGWTRFVDQAGTTIINHIPESGLRLCGGGSPGWLFGVYPSILYSTTIGTMCYVSPAGTPCARIAAQAVRVTHCGAYFVFDMPVAPECPLRACSIDQPMPF